MISVAAVVLCYVIVIGALSRSPQRDVTVPAHNAVAAATIAGNTPVLLSIPAIDVTANVQQVGLTASGKMAVPNNFRDVGWYRYGTVPGHTGSAVIAGHVNNGLAFPAVFSKLDQLTPGDDIYLTTKNGKKLHFVVVSSQAYSKDAATADIFSDDSGKLLKLITCTGTWLPSLKTHDQRLVVTAVLV